MTSTCTKQFIGLLIRKINFQKALFFQFKTCDNTNYEHYYCNQSTKTLIHSEHYNRSPVCTFLAFLSRSFFPLSRILEMGKGGFYAVARGRTLGVYHSWDECKAQVDGFHNARFKKFATDGEAKEFILKNSNGVFPVVQGGSSIVPASSLKKIGSETTKKYASAGTVPYKTVKKKSASKGLIFLDSIPSSSQSKRQISTSALGKRSINVTEEETINKRPKQEEANTIDPNGFAVDEQGYVVVFTDGACKANGRRGARAGIGVWFGEHHPLNISEPVKGRQTNNTAEIQAAEHAILKAKEKGINKLHIKTDSKFTISCVTEWMPNWKKKNWKTRTGEDVKNKEDLEKLDKAKQMMDVKWSYVAGHKGHHGNEEADKLAVLGSLK